MRLTRRGRYLAGVLAAVTFVAIGVLGWRIATRDPLVRPDDVCAERPPLSTWHGVTLQPVAMRAFRKAVRLSPGPIFVVQSYRSCGQQAQACRTICGDPTGCPGRCASPGTSYHQLGAAVDLTQGSLDTPGVIEAMRRAGWCQSQPATDPGHFSFDGCH